MDDLMGAIEVVKPEVSLMLAPQQSVRRKGTRSAVRPDNKSSAGSQVWARMFFQLVDDGSGGCDLTVFEGIMKHHDPGVSRDSLTSIFEMVGAKAEQR